MKTRRLRTAWWILCGIAVAVLCCMWLRSYWSIDSVEITLNRYSGPALRLASVPGRTTLELQNDFANYMETTIEFHHGRVDPNVRYLRFWRVLFRIDRGEGRCLISVPYWLSLLLYGAFAVSVSRLNTRFTLRTLLVAMAAVSLLLWGVMSAMRR
jgi:hypothetical protein